MVGLFSPNLNAMNVDHRYAIGRYFVKQNLQIS